MRMQHHAQRGRQHDEPTQDAGNGQKTARWNTDRIAEASSSLRDPLCERFAAHRSAFLRDGYVLLRGVMPLETLAGIQTDLERVVDGYAERLKAAGRLAGTDGRQDTSSGLPFRERYTELYRANKFGPHNRGARSDLPALFRKEGHTAGVYAFLSDPQVLELARCMLPSMPPRGQPLRLYPVYMLRGKVPEAIAGPANSVDWHQDAQYTYYWYSDHNTTRAQIDEYTQSIVNFWVPVTDTTHELGPMQFARRPSHAPRGALTRADLRCRGCDEGAATRVPKHPTSPGNGSPAKTATASSRFQPYRGMTYRGMIEAAAREAAHARAHAHTPTSPLTTAAGDALPEPVEFLRVADIDAYAAADGSRLVAMSPLRRGDVVIFDQYMYHRGLPNQTPNATRWSLDFRFQDAAADTLRSESGFLVAPRPPYKVLGRMGTDAPLIRSAEDWAAATPSLRLSDLRQLTGNPRIGGHDWAAQHHAKADKLRSAIDLEREGYAETDDPGDHRRTVRPRSVAEKHADLFSAAEARRQPSAS